MINPLYTQLVSALERQIPQAATPSTSDFSEVFDSAAQTAGSTLPGSQQSLGDPNVQGWLNSFYVEKVAEPSASGTSGPITAETSYEPAAGAASNYSPDGTWGPDQIYQQALANQCGNSFATLSGVDPKNLTSQLPGIPSQAGQQAFDGMMAEQNAQRLATGQAIDTAAYWSDPGSVKLDGTTYTSQELGYAGPAQSSGPEPIFISKANQVAGTDTFTVPGYSGTVKGIQPGAYYTLDQLVKAGLKAGQPDAQYYPGSWSLPENA